MADETSHKITDQERLELAAKLDQELDDFINGLEKKRYADGWPEDRWQEEMDKHPFFMKKPPGPGEDVHPLFEGIQQLKYDPEENTTDELALNYKEDGNFYMKHKKFRMAVLGFTEGIKAKSQNSETNAILYNNRSAAQFFLKNYRTSLLDAQKALQFKPDYAKARWRAAQCAFQINKFDVCIQYCDEILENNENDEHAQELLKKCKKKKVEVERNDRKLALEEKKKEKDIAKLIEALKSRNIKFDDLKDKKELTEKILKPKFLPLEHHPVKLDENNVLHWPTAFSYPEFLFSDFQQQLSEEVVMQDCIADMFSERLQCDVEYKYKTGNLNVYYENRKAATVHNVNLSKTIKEILEEKSFYVSGGSLLFYVVPKDSQIENEFRQQKRRPLIYS